MVRRCVSIVLAIVLFSYAFCPSSAAADNAADMEIFQYAEYYASLTHNIKNKNALSLFLMAAVPVESGVRSNLIVPVPYSDKAYLSLIKKGKSFFREYTGDNNFGLYDYSNDGSYVGPLQIGSTYFQSAIAKNALYTGNRTNLPDSFNAVAGKMDNSMRIFKHSNATRTLPNTKYAMVALYAIAHNYGESVFTCKDNEKPLVNGEIYTPTGAFSWAKAVGSPENIFLIREYIERKNILHYDQAPCRELAWALYCNARETMLRNYGSFGDADIDGVSGYSSYKREVFTARKCSTSYLGSRNEKLFFPIKVLISAIIVEERYSKCSWNGNRK